MYFDGSSEFNITPYHYLMQTHEVEFNLNFRMNKTCKLNRQLIKSVLVLGLRSFSFFLLFYFLLEILFRILFIHSCFSLSLTCFFYIYSLSNVLYAREENTQTRKKIRRNLPRWNVSKST